MNSYITEFFANCPTNGARIKYALRIDSAEVISVEDIVVTVECIDDKYHEEIADELFERFGGRQTLRADHHSVTIETLRAPQMTATGVPSPTHPGAPA